MPGCHLQSYTSLLHRKLGMDMVKHLIGRTYACAQGTHVVLTCQKIQDLGACHPQ